MTTIYDVARVAGVSTATVSRVLRGSELVHADTRQRVLGVIAELDPFMDDIFPDSLGKPIFSQSLPMFTGARQ